MLSAGVGSWMVALADPCGAKRLLPGRPLSTCALAGLIELSDSHGVLPAVTTNLRQVAQERGAGCVAGASRSEASAQEELDAALEEARQILRKRTAFCLLLRRQVDELAAAFGRRSVSIAVLKGADFADRLYPSAGLRTFRDVDLLVPPEALDEAGVMMQQLGYLPKATAMKYAAGYGEQSYSRQGQPGGVVEVHWNLVNSPTLRRGISAEFGDLQFVNTSADEGGLARPSPASLLLIAAVHAAASHCFDRLQLLCDVRQAARGAAGEIDVDWLAHAIRRTGSDLAVSTALGLTEKILGGDQCSQVRRRLDLSERSRLPSLLLTRGVVLRSHARIDSFRRCLFRAMLKRPRRMPSQCNISAHHDEKPAQIESRPPDGGRL